MKIEWREIGSSDWRAKVDGLLIILHKRIGYSQETWFVTNHDLQIMNRELGEIPLEQAKEAALVVVLDRIKALAKLVKPLEKAIAAGRK